MYFYFVREFIPILNLPYPNHHTLLNDLLYHRIDFSMKLQGNQDIIH